MGEVEEVFHELLGGKESDKRKDRDRRRGDEKKGISSVEVRRAIGKLKDGKAAGLDEILNEVWRYGRKVEGMD